MRVSLITLGCNKNEIDSEMILGYLQIRGYEITTDLKSANIIIINTCGFILSAKEEAIATILDVADYKITGKCKHLIVTGCFAKRYKKEILENFKEVDLVIGVDEYKDFDLIFSSYISSSKLGSSLEFKNRIVSSLFPTAYIRISDGCNNCCSYCAIPLIRGNLKSRTTEDIVEEAIKMAESGIEELVIISQDTSSYGLDIYGELKLCELLRKLSKIKKIKWIRVLYMYPGKITDELITEFKTNKKICKYFDIPIQHISDKILKKMNRHTNKKEIYDLIEQIRNEIPEAIIRTTVMVGFQDETEEDFEELLKAIKELKFERLGAFKYSKEEDTKAFDILGDISDSVKEKRYNRVMKTQKETMQDFQNKMIEKEFEVIVQDITKDEKYFICRSYMDAPDVDPKILLEVNIETTKKIVIGGWYRVKIISIKEYDYICNLMGE